MNGSLIDAGKMDYGEIGVLKKSENCFLKRESSREENNAGRFAPKKRKGEKFKYET